MAEQQPPGKCHLWRRTERRTRAAKEIEMEIRRRERQRARRFADRGPGQQDRLRYLPLLPMAAPDDCTRNSSYR